MPMLGVMGMPSATMAMAPNCHPPSAWLPNAPRFLGEPGFHRPLITRFRPTLKADSPRFMPNEYHGGAFHSLVKVSAAALPEVVSMLFLQVNHPSTCKPRLILLSRFT